jgi:hypothetical protein
MCNVEEISKECEGNRYQVDHKVDMKGEGKRQARKKWSYPLEIIDVSMSNQACNTFARHWTM